MKKLIFVILILINIVSSNIIYSQNSGSLELSGGIVLKSSSSDGFNAILQYNYQFSNKIQFYIYSGYFYWDKTYATFIEELNPPQKETHFRTYTEDNHILIPIYIGSRMDLHTNKLFTLFASFEIGYSNLSYNSYNVEKVIDPDNGVVLSYETDLNSKSEISENLIGLGLGAGIKREVAEAINIVLFYKLNTQLNSKYYGALSNKATYSVINIGINVGL